MPKRTRQSAKSTLRRRASLRSRPRFRRIRVPRRKVQRYNTAFLDTSTILETDSANGVTPGSIDGGQFDVTADGAAIYTLPLWVPPGRLGIQPLLALNYNSRAGNGPLGVGWSLSGISKITRGNKTVADDGTPEPIHYDKDDALYLDGERLILVNGVQGMDGSEYRTKQDDFTKIILHDVDSGPTGQVLGPTWFEAFHKDGRISIFGGVGESDLGSRFEGQAKVYIPWPGSWPAGSYNPGDPINDQISRDDVASNFCDVEEFSARYAWSLSSVRDRAGNELRIYYDGYPSRPGQPTTDRDYLPVRILYTGSPTDGIPAMRSVDLIWEDRPDVETRFISGLRLFQKKRLSEIRMNGPNPVDAGLLRRYLFGYRNDSVSHRSLLTSVQELDGSGVSKGAHTFEWEPGNSTFRRIDTRITDIISTPPGRATLSGRIRVADFNGDGHDDILYIKASDWSQFYILLSDPSSPTGFGQPFPTGIPVPSSFSLNNPGVTGQLYIFRDAAGDWMNILVFDNTVLGYPTYRVYHAGIDRAGAFGSVGAFVVFPGRPIFSMGGGAFVQGIVEMADFDGDGMPDLLLSDLTGAYPSWYLRWNQGGNLNFDSEAFVDGFPANHYYLNLDGNSATGILTSGVAFLGNNDDPRYCYMRLAKNGNTLSTSVGLTLLLKDNQYLFANLNGSGPPCAFSLGYKIQGTVVSGPQVWENVGGFYGFAPPQAVALNFLTLLGAGGQLGDMTPLIRVLDIDQDGQDELIVRTRTAFQDDPMYVLKWTGAVMTENQLPADLFRNIWLFDYEFEMFEVLDYQGGGLGDMVMFSDGQLRLFLRNGSKADMMTAVVDGLGARIDIQYAPLSDANVHSPGQGYTYPQQSVSSKIWVVAEYQADNGIGGVNTYRYRYQGGVQDITGNGFLGFTSRDVLHVEKNIGTHITYLLTSFGRYFYPLRGRPIDEVTRVPLGNNTERILSKHYDYTVRSTSDNPPYFVFASKIVTQETENRNGIATMSRSCTLTQDLDAFGNIVEQSEAWSDGNASGYTATYLNNPNTWLIGLLDVITETSNSPNGQQQTRVRAYEYDNEGFLSRLIIEPGNKGAGGYEPLGSQPDGVKTLFRTIERYTNGNIYRIIDEEMTGERGEKRSIVYIYDDLEHIFPVEVVNSLNQHLKASYHPGLGVPVMNEDENGVQRSWQYDGFGRVREEHSPDGNHISTHYRANLLGMKVIRKMVAGPVVQTDFDALGRVVGTTAFARTDGAAVMQEIGYDAFGRRGRVSRPHFPNDQSVYDSFAYDNLDRPVSLANADGSGSTSNYLGEWIITTDVRGNSAAFRLDNLDRIVFSTDRDAALAGSGGGPPSGMTFDMGPFNSVTRVTDILGNKTDSVFDRLGRLIDLQDPDRGHYHYDYNAFGDLTQETKGSNERVQFYYDSLGRLYRAKDILNGDVRITWDVATNGSGKISEIWSPKGNVRTTFEYDAIGRVAKKAWKIGSATYALSTIFDNVGRVAGLAYPQVGNLPPFRIAYHYGNFGQLLRILDASSGHMYWQYVGSDASGQFGQELLGNGLINSRTENPSRPGVLADIQTFDSGMKLLRDLNYGFDRNLNLELRHDAILKTEEKFEYDRFDRLQRWTWHGKAGLRRTRWDYDDIGNITKRAIEAGPGNDLTYTYDNTVAGPHAVVATSLGNYAYNAKGHQIAAPGRKVAYGRGDLPIRITRLSQKHPGKIFFTYDGELNRVRSTDSGLKQITDTIAGLYEYRRQQSQQSSDGHHAFNITIGGRLIARRTWKVANQHRVSNRVEYLHDDHQGSIDMISNAAGKVSERLKYDPFGRRVRIKDPAKYWEPSNLALHTGYTAQEHVDDYDLIDMKGRFYDPIIGKFLTPDPFVPNPLKPQSWNRYAYVLNNPLTLRDPSGFDEDNDEPPLPGVCAGQCEMPDENLPRPGNANTNPGSDTAPSSDDGTNSGPGPINDSSTTDSPSNEPNSPQQPPDWQQGPEPADVVGHLFTEFLTGQGKRVRTFGPDSRMTSELRDAAGVQKALDLFYSKNRGASPSSNELSSITNFNASFGPGLKPFRLFGTSGPVKAGLNLTQQFVGSFRVDIFPTGNSQLSIVVTNTTSLPSLLYHIPFVPEINSGAYSNITQYFWWTESIDPSRLDWSPDPEGWKPGDVQWQYYHFNFRH